MSRYLLSRMLACAVLGLFFGMIVHADYVKWSTAGLQSFLAYQQVRYIKHIATPSSGFVTFLGVFLVALLAAAFYELCAFTFTTIASRFLRAD